MKKVNNILAVLATAFLMAQGAAFAGTVEGTVKSVDSMAKTAVVTTEAGDSNVTFNADTEWPEGVTDPGTLVGKKVSVETDDATSVATSFTESEAAAE